ncbi:hypothetical protein LTR08_007824 [Meristemomyces frigidus]|nr:hypothetical protein LTR08_007824 [Meristemomyces frigidus]
MAEFDYSVKASASYMIHAGSIRRHHDKLKGLQLSFIFLQSVCSPQRAEVVTSGGGLAQLGSFEGTIHHLPVYSGANVSAGGAPVSYTVTLTLHAPSPLGQGHVAPVPPSHSGQPAQDRSDRLEEAKKKRLKRKLAALPAIPFSRKRPLALCDPGRKPRLKSERQRKAERVQAKRQQEAKRAQEERLRKAERAQEDADDILAYLLADGHEDDDNDIGNDKVSGS